MALSAKSKELLGSASTATIQTQLFIRGFRNQFLNGIILRTPSHKNFVGEAFTLRYIPAREDLDKIEAFKDLQLNLLGQGRSWLLIPVVTAGPLLLERS